MDRLTAMRVFVAVIEHGSQTAAADRLDMSRAMVTRYLAELETWLGERLLHRTTRRLSLTDAGEECLTHCRQVLGEIAVLEACASQRQQTPRGLIRVTAACSFGQHHLAPAIADYVARYPHTRVDLLLLDRTVDLVADRIDLAVRIDNDLDPTLIARQLAVCRSVVCAAPSYLERRGAPQTPADLADHNCLTYCYYGRSEWRFERAGASAVAHVGGNISANEVAALLHATLVGAGIALQPTYLAAPYLRDGRLVRLLPDWTPQQLGIHGVYATRRFLPPTLRTLLDHLAERFGPEPSWDAPD
ncbi:MAG TPA: LysR family transcriptional regulator [Rhodocyclaceae bacterium]|nr:LysR family transcriptional regulator [Rhodocyclaceae bacterium]